MKLDETSAATDAQVFYQSVADKLEEALGRSQPHLEICFSDLSVSCEVPRVKSRQGDEVSPELPTLWSTLKHATENVVSSKGTEQRVILNGVSGVLRPGTMTLVLGQPGSGKSTLLKALSGRLGHHVQLAGDITYNGLPQHSIVKKLPQLAAAPERSPFPTTVGQGDALVRARLQCRSKQSRHDVAGARCGPRESRSAQVCHRHVRELPRGGQGAAWTAELLGYPCDNLVRGVSGGEKKRVTTGEMVLGMQPAVFMDEISTGLDSAATFDIIHTQRTIARTLGKTMVISLLQPSPDVFALFDDIILLNEGQVTYYGPRQTIVEYFRDLGLSCPPNRDVADFLLDLGTPQQYAYESTSSTSPFGRAEAPRLASEYADKFRASSIHQGNLSLLATPLDHDSQDKWSEHAASLPQFQRSVWVNTRTLVARQLMLIMRDVNTLRSRVVLVLLSALVAGTVFMDASLTNVPLVLGVLFLSGMFPLFEQTSQLSMFIEMRDLFYKQRSANFFQTSAYVLANIVSQVPIALPESFVFGAFLYWIGGLEASVGSFIVYEIVVFLIVMAAVLIFFFVAAISPNIYVTNPLALGILQVILVFSGFMVTKEQIPDYLFFLYWLNPLSWGFRALAVNQYRSATFDVCIYEDVDYCDQFGKTMGEYYLGVYSIPAEKEWVVFGIVYLVGLILVFTILSYLALEYKRYEGGFRVIRSGAMGGNDDDSYQLTTTPKEGSRTSPSNSSGKAVSIDVQGHFNAFIPVTVGYKDLWYSVPNPSKSTESIDLLKGISGVARPGTITALMGSSGAGKTTLMDVIAGRKNTGSIRGKIMLNGHEATELAIRRCTGYCEQTDIHSETATFREALTFSAFLRQDSDVPASVKLESVNEIVNLLGLENVADHMVRGRSLEQLKRLTIGVELAAQPSVLFLDEPTSGLDASFAKMIMDGIRKVANSGRTVICTIHQPSYEVFSVFDNLLLLKRGGETVYYGELGQDCRTLVDYFEAIPGVQPLPEKYNPATWMLECIGAGVTNRVSEGEDKDFVQRFNESELKAQLEVTLEEDGVGRATPDGTALRQRDYDKTTALTAP